MPYGTLAIDTLNASTGVLATQNGMSGIIKAWVRFGSDTGTCVIASSFNVSSVTYVSTGTCTANFTTNLPNANFGVIGTSGRTDSSGNTAGFASGAPTVSSVTMRTTAFNVASPYNYDWSQITVAVLSTT